MRRVTNTQGETQEAWIPGKKQQYSKCLHTDYYAFSKYLRKNPEASPNV